MYSRLNYLAGLVALVFLFGLSSCGEDTLVGTDIVNNEEIDINFLNDLNISAKTINVDSLTTYRPASERLITETFNSLLLGEINDPNFGISQAGIVSELSFLASFPSYADAQFDSLVLSLSIAGLDIPYGESGPQEFQVFRIMEPLNTELTYSSNDLPSLSMDLIGQATLEANYDSIQIFNPTVDSIAGTYAQIRIPMDNTFGMNLLQDTVAAAGSDELQDFINGIYIKTADGSNAMHSINMTSSFMSMYYTQNDEKEIYNYSLSIVRYNHINNIKVGYPAFDALNDLDLGDSLLYLSGAVGYDVELDLGEIKNLRDSILINDATLEITVTASEQDTSVFAILENIIASTYNEEGELSIINDVSNAILRGSIEQYFGGDVFDDFDGLVRLNKYKINITNYLKDVIDDEVDQRLVLSALSAKENPGRAVLFGPGHSTYPLKLNLTYTVP